MQPEIPAKLHNAIPAALIDKHHYLCQSTNMNISTIDAHRSKVKTHLICVFPMCMPAANITRIDRMSHYCRI
jgi:hypothetical protein